MSVIWGVVFFGATFGMLWGIMSSNSDRAVYQPVQCTTSWCQSRTITCQAIYSCGFRCSYLYLYPCTAVDIQAGYSNTSFDVTYIVGFNSDLNCTETYPSIDCWLGHITDGDADVRLSLEPVGARWRWLFAWMLVLDIVDVVYGLIVLIICIIYVRRSNKRNHSENSV